MQKYILQILILFISILGFAQKIKSITEFKKEKDTLIKLRQSSFAKNGNITSEIRYGYCDAFLKTLKNNNKSFLYENGKIKLELLCEYFVKQDNCSILSFKKFDYDSIAKTETSTMFEADSSVRYIRQIKKEKQVKYIKTYSWEFSPTKNIDYKKAVIITDTIIYDRKGREIKGIHHYNNSFKNEYVEIYKYSKKNSSLKLVFKNRDTIIFYKYSKLQKLIDKKRMDYKFNDIKIYSYKIEYY